MHKLGSPTCSLACLITPPNASTSYCPGIGHGRTSLLKPPERKAQPILKKPAYPVVLTGCVLMVGASRNRGRIVTNLVVPLRAQPGTREWGVIADFGLDAGSDTLRYPDIVVDRAGGGGRDYTTTA